MIAVETVLVSVLRTVTVTREPDRPNELDVCFVKRRTVVELARVLRK